MSTVYCCGDQVSFALEKLLSGMCKMGFSLYSVFHNKTGVLVAHHELILFLDS